MDEQREPHMHKTDGLEQAVYQIVVQGELDDKWSAWFTDVTIAFGRTGDDPPLTVLTAQMIDQARLRGILNKLWDMNLTVIALNRIEEPECRGEE